MDANMTEWPLLSLFGSAFISSTIAPGGSELVLLYWLNEQRYSAVLLIGIATFGNTLGAMTTWGLGWWAAKKYALEHHLAASHQTALNRVRRYGYWALLFSWLPVVGDGFCFAAGWLRFAWLPGLMLIAAGKLLRYGAIAYAFL
jgi:membrane protein YqaA with SNARE-associated domain